MAQEQIKQQNEETTVVSGDWFLMQKASTDETVKVDAGNIVPDGTVVPNKLMATTGSSWAWQSWTPTWTNLTVGNGTVNAKYVQTGKTVFYRLVLVMGSTTSVGVGGYVTFTLPAPYISPGSSGTASIMIGQAWFEDTGTANYQGQVHTGAIGSGSVAYISASTTGGVYRQAAYINATIPFTWGTGDSINCYGFYEAA